MNKKQMKRLQAISHRESPARTKLNTEFLSNLKSKLAERKYRADLSFVTAAKDTTGTFKAEIPYNPELGHPSENDLMTLVAQNYPTHEIDWELIQVDPEEGVISLMLEPSVEMVPVESVRAIPPEFVAIGTGLYKRAADNSGNVQEIWTLKKNDNGLALYRNQDDIEVTAEEDGFKAGDVVMVEGHGPGRIKRFDEMGNAFVTVGNKVHLVAAMDMQPFDITREKTKLTKYYEEIYGKDFAEALTREYGDARKNK